MQNIWSAWTVKWRPRKRPSTKATKVLKSALRARRRGLQRRCAREEQVAADFNTAIRAYKAANPD